LLFQKPRGRDSVEEGDTLVKLVVAIVQDRHAGHAIDNLIEGGFGATRINTAGGFLKRGNATILTGVDDAKTEAVIQILRDSCDTPDVSTEGIRTTGIVFVLPVVASMKI
jgi:uncharacterized protein YaaQ